MRQEGVEFVPNTMICKDISAGQAAKNLMPSALPAARATPRTSRQKGGS